MTRTAKAAACAAALILASTLCASAASYEFLAAPEIDLNRVYRLDKATGEMGACQYGVPDDAPAAKETAAVQHSEIGVTLCYPPGEGGGPQSQSEYALVASRHNKEGGVFRVDVRAGTMSICYVLDHAVVCTPPAK